MSDTIELPTTESPPNMVTSVPETTEPTLGQTIMRRAPLLGVAIASAAGAGIVLAAQAIRRRRQSRRQLDLLYAASAARGNLRNVGHWASQPLMRRPDLLAALLVELAFVIGKARSRGSDLAGRVR